MVNLVRTNSQHPDFRLLVQQLDADLRLRDGEEHGFFAQFNKIEAIQHCVVLYEAERPVGCGALREYSPGVMEVKRMFVPPECRSKGFASKVLAELEKWAAELGYQKCILETGIRQPEAIRLYEKNHYVRIPNFPPYAEVESSVCFEKKIN